MKVLQVLILIAASSVAPATGFTVLQTPPHASLTLTRMVFIESEDLFAEDEEMLPIAYNYVGNKCKAIAEANGHDKCTKDDVAAVLKAILPPASVAELEDEVNTLLGEITDYANMDEVSDVLVKNTYWKSAGDLTVKELMYFDALHFYYTTGLSLLDNDDYGELKDNLTWEGSSVATMNKDEAAFVTAVAAARRGEAFMDDAEYKALKGKLKAQKSWVTNREQDSLEKLGINTFMGYLHTTFKK